MTTALLTLDYQLSDRIEIVLISNGSKRDAMLNALHNRIIAISGNGNSALPLFEGRQAEQGETIAYVSRNSACQLPVATVRVLKAQLKELGF